MRKLLYVFIVAISIVAYSIKVCADGGVKIYKDGSFTTIYANEIDSLVFFYDTNYQNHEYVDLGLPSGTKWATSNVGADLPWDKGNLYAWGETEQKSNYSRSTYKFYNNGYTKYGTIDGKYRLEAEDDVARCLWGKKWRMPTYEELQELKENCIFTWVDQDNMNVVKATGPNGNFIYFPLPGNYTGSSIYYEGSVGSYWSSDLMDDTYAKDLDFSQSSQSLNSDMRYHGQSVRPVYIENSEDEKLLLVTKVFNSDAQPPIVGGWIWGYQDKKIREKGIIVSKNEDVRLLEGYRHFEPYFYQMYDDHATWVDGPSDYRIIDCTDVNEELFACKLMTLEGNTDYFVRAFVVTSGNEIIYGDIKEIHSADFSRYDGRADYANVWHAFDCTAFDLVTDEIINPADGFYYSTNEKPSIVKFQQGTSRNLCYKFVTEWNYKLWYYHSLDVVSEEDIVNVPIMRLNNGKLEIMKNPKDADKDITIYYSINGVGDRPETFSDEYVAPLSVNLNDIVYCYAIDSHGAISYTNMYVVIEVKPVLM